MKQRIAAIVTAVAATLAAIFGASHTVKTHGPLGFVPLPLVASQGGTGLTSPGTTGNVLTSNGTGWTSSTPAGGGLAENYLWYRAPDFGQRFGTWNNDANFFVGSAYMFQKASTVTGVRYYCEVGGSQTFTVTLSSETTFGGGHTPIDSKTCTQSAGVINTCSFNSSHAISNLALVYMVAVLGSAGATQCSFSDQPNPPNYPVVPYLVNATTPALMPDGPVLWRHPGLYYGSYGNTSSYPTTNEISSYATVEPVFTVP